MKAFLRQVLVFILTWEARLVLRRHHPRVIAVTGSVGKTSTKDAIYAALAPHVHIRKSEKTLNTDIGVPLAILGCGNAWGDPLLWIRNIVSGLRLIAWRAEYPEWLVLEVGADRPGDIRRIARWLRPDIAVMTAVPDIPVHVEFFPSPEALRKEKRSLAEYLRPGGKLVLNGEDARMVALSERFRGAMVKYGVAPENDFSASDEEVLYDDKKPVGMSFRVNHAGSSLPVVVYGALGRPRLYAGLAALAVAKVIGVDLVSAAKSLGDFVPPPGRMRILAGLRGALLIDDSYNSSPAAAASALETLKSLKYVKRRVAVLGDMLELGRYSAEAHREAGRQAAACADLLVTVGFRSRATVEAALDAGMPDESIRQYEHFEAARAGAELQHEVRAGDVVLVKGSQSMRMERVVEALMAEPARARELLVRQNPEWLARGSTPEGLAKP
jgi:UDP-N-acetylmuramoyl-tripeptide--D-alanyl-D-alanine ligase